MSIDHAEQVTYRTSTVTTSDGAPFPLVSVVIPVYNAAATLGQQLASLAIQDYPHDWEIVVADNGSTDASVLVAEAFLDSIPSLRVVDASARRGPGYARNFGTRAARGDVILYLDADDEAEPGYVRRMVDSATQHGLVGAHRETRTLQWYRAGSPPRASEVSIGTHAIQAKTFPFLPWAFGGGCGIARDAFEAIGGWSEVHTRAGGEDVDFCWRAQLAGYTMGFAPGALVHYRQRAGVWTRMRQQFTYGACAPDVYLRFRDRGARPRSARVVIGTVAKLVVAAPLQPWRSAERREAWAGALSAQAGRVWGSVRHRCLYL
ncbi:glycosyltransferase family 2 protein [Egibacter rhizosphaerae]|uniref:Glycosyltransferase family 2 protein n=1 Tax=Egibacter rhizosphaerae TaxID=1670831 RepID=A0A411YGD9_9ACTN|nr:glycosyltransferase family A protein [Egibacter rhizosphaerae]QBI20288.1 glycosyltransferase family 2 protein [Egibacter rhizosphaerae]